MRPTPIFDTNIFGHVKDGSIPQNDWRRLLAHRPGHVWPLSAVTAMELLDGIYDERPEKFIQPGAAPGGFTGAGLEPTSRTLRSVRGTAVRESSAPLRYPFSRRCGPRDAAHGGAKRNVQVPCCRLSTVSLPFPKHGSRNTDHGSHVSKKEAR